MAYDLKIAGGDIVDGTGGPRRRGDLGIRDGKVVALGAAPDSAARTIDATGMVVAPGFVDVHTHYDAQVLWDPMLTISPWHGVTTVVVGNCGFGVAPTRPEHRDLVLRTLERVEGMSLAALKAGIGPDWPFQTFPQYMDALERQPLGINVAVMVGHTPVRLSVMGDAATLRAAPRSSPRSKRPRSTVPADRGSFHERTTRCRIITCARWSAPRTGSTASRCASSMMIRPIARPAGWAAETCLSCFSPSRFP